MYTANYLVTYSTHSISYAHRIGCIYSLTRGKNKGDTRFAGVTIMTAGFILPVFAWLPLYHKCDAPSSGVACHSSVVIWAPTDDGRHSNKFNNNLKEINRIGVSVFLSSHWSYGLYVSLLFQLSTRSSNYLSRHWKQMNKNVLTLLEFFFFFHFSCL